jgi:hypothetical protein
VALGHSKLDTTTRYAHVASKVLREMVSPLDRLGDTQTSANGQMQHGPVADAIPNYFSVNLNARIRHASLCGAVWV